MQELTSRVRVKNLLGIHTRPATSIVKLLKDCESQVSFTYGKETVNARSLLSILTLAIGVGSDLVITVQGSDAEETMRKLVAAFEEQFEA